MKLVQTEIVSLAIQFTSLRLESNPRPLSVTSHATAKHGLNLQNNQVVRRGNCESDYRNIAVQIYTY